MTTHIPDSRRVGLWGGYIVHFDPNQTTEGLGSHIRGTLFPLLHLALELNLQPLFDNNHFHSNRGRDYSGLHLAQFLDLKHMDDYEELEKKCHVLEVNAWTDKSVGSACGDAVDLAHMLRTYLKQTALVADKPLLLSLTGAFRYMNPTPSVYQWLQNASQPWTRHDRTGLHVAAHVRVPEDFCSQNWKDENDMEKFIAALQRVQNHFGSGSWNRDVVLEVFTEEHLTTQDEERLISHFPTATVFRGTTETLLEDLRRMASADIFIPASSHLSALAGYLSHGLIILSDPSRIDYFQPHIQLGCHIVNASDDSNLQLALQQSFLQKTTVSDARG